MLSEHWWMTEYATDIIEIMREREKKGIKYFGRSPQLQERPSLVDWLLSTAGELHLRRTTVYLAVYLLDYFMDSHDLCVRHLTFIAASCLLIAAKVEDNYKYTPRISQLNSMIPKFNYPIREFIKMELTVLGFFNWYIMIPTVSHFVDYFSAEATSYESSNNPSSNVKPLRKFTYYLDYFMQLSLQEMLHTRFPPSLIAASTIAATRRCLMITPVWSAELEKISSYSLSQLQSCYEIMIRTAKCNGQPSE